MPQKPSAPTLKDVAAHAGVSTVTVSTVLNGFRSNTRVSEATRQRILEAVADLRYQPNSVARSLRHQRTNVIGFFSDENRFLDATHPFFASLIAGLCDACGKLRKDLLIHGILPGTPADEVYGELANGKIDGLVLFLPSDDPLIAMLVDSHLPVVAVADAIPGLPSVVVDDWTGGRLQAQHLWERGHRHVAYIGSRQRQQSVVRRRESFCEKAQLLGMEVTPIDDGSDPTGFAAQLPAIIQGLPPANRPTAVVLWADEFASLAVEAAVEAGMRIPQDLAIIAFNGVAGQARYAWPLTTIRAPWRDVAVTAVSVLVDQIEGREAAAETVLPVDLVCGSTT